MEYLNMFAGHDILNIHDNLDCGPKQECLSSEPKVDGINVSPEGLVVCAFYQLPPH
jgi:hypothetical protein